MSDRDAQIDAAIAEYLAAAVPPDRDAFLAKHADLADSLRDFIDDHERMRVAASPAVTVTQSPIPAPESATVTATQTSTGPSPLGRVRYFGDYELLEEIARGGMGVVFKARQVSLNRVVALKMILAGQLASEADVRRFHAEAEAAAGLGHPNILPIYEVGQHNGQEYFAMKLVDGGSLSARMAEFTKSPRRGIEFLIAVARAVHFAHQRGVLHRDLKPGNILLDSDGTPFVCDFGLAKHVNADSSMTRTGAIVGTPSYMAPEQARAEKQLSTAIDVYALGAILYELIAGRPPFRADSVLETVRQVIEMDAIDPRRFNAAADRDLAVIALKCLQKEPAKRYDTAADLADDLGRWQRGEPISARPVASSERIWRWCKRNPTLAAVSGTSVAAIAALLIAYLVQSNIMYGRVSKSLEQEQAAMKEARANATLSQERLVKQYVSAGTRHLDDGDWMGALPWFVEALALDELNPDRAKMHRMRIGTILRMSPRLEHIFEVEGSIYFAAFSPDGKWIVTGGADRDHVAVARVWDAKTRQPATPWLKHTTMGDAQWEMPVAHATFSRDCRQLATANAKEIAIWDVNSGNKISSWSHETYIPALRFSPDGSQLLVVSAVSVGRDVLRMQAQTWDVRKGMAVSPAIISRTLFQDYELTHDAAFSDDGKRVAMLEGESSDPHVRIIDTATGKDATPMSRIPKQPRALTRVLFTADGDQFITVDTEGNAKLWAVATCKLVKDLGLIGKHVTLADDDRRLVGVDPSLIRVRSAESGYVVSTIKPDGVIVKSYPSENGLRVMTELEGGIFELFDVGRSTPVGPRIRSDWSSRVDLSPDGRRLLMTTDNHHALLWDFGACEPSRPLDETSWMVRGPTFNFRQETDAQAISSDGRRIAIARSGRVQVYDSVTGSPIGKAIAYVGKAFRIAMDHSGSTLAVIRDDKGRRVVKYEVDSGRTIGTPVELPPLDIAIFSRDLRWLASSGRDQAAKDHFELWNLDSGKQGLARNSELPIRFSDFSRESNRLALGIGTDWQVIDAATAAPIGPIFQQPNHVRHAELTSDGNGLLVCFSALVASWETAQTRFWDARTGQIISEIPFGNEAEETAYLDRSGERVVLANRPTARVYDAKTSRPLTPPMRHATFLQGASFNDDGQFVVTSLGGFERRLWDSTTAEPLTPILRGDHFVSLTSDGFLVSFGDSPVVHNVRPDERPLKELRALALILSGHRVDETGGYVPLTETERADLLKEWRATPAELSERERNWHSAMSTASEAAERWTNAIEHLDAMIAAQPHRWRLFARRGRAYSELSKWEDALASLTVAIDKGGDDPTIWLDRGHALAEIGRYRDAAADFVHAGSLQVVHTGPWQALAWLAAGDLAEFRKVRGALFAYFEGPDARNRSVEYLIWPVVLSSDPPGDLSKAISLLAESEKSSPEDEEDLRTFGAALFRAGKPKEAVVQLLKACEVRKEPFPSAWLFLAMAYQKLDQKDEARKWFDKTKAQMDTPGYFDDLDWMERLKLRMLRDETERSLGMK